MVDYTVSKQDNQLQIVELVRIQVEAGQLYKQAFDEFEALELVLGVFIAASIGLFDCCQNLFLFNQVYRYKPLHHIDQKQIFPVVFNQGDLTKREC
jgi:hypothetical protein